MAFDPKAAEERKRPEVEKLLRQFLDTDGPKGTTDAYRLGWVRAFGRRTGEHSGMLRDPDTGEWFDTDHTICSDSECWCRKPEDEEAPR